MAARQAKIVRAEVLAAELTCDLARCAMLQATVAQELAHDQC
jgi:hypothetical protein